MLKKISQHPTQTFASDIQEICSPLHLFDITYFSHIHIDNKGRFTGIGNSPGFSEHYLKNKYFNADIHMAKNQNLGQYVLWDALERSGQSERMHREAAQFGIQHTFTIIDKTLDDGIHYYHFSNNAATKTINQFYITHIDLLKSFAEHFKEKVSHSKELSYAHELKFSLDASSPGYTLKSNNDLTPIESKRDEFKKLITSASKGQTLILPSHISLDQWKLTKRETDCVNFILRGKTAKETAEILNLSVRTIEQYIGQVKDKLQVDTKSKLITKLLNSAQIF